MVEELRLKLFGTPPFEDWTPQWLNWNYGSLIYKNIQVVYDESYTHAAVFGLATPQLNIPKENVVGFACEPKAIYNLTDYSKWAINKIGTYFCSDSNGLPENFKEYFTFLAPMPLINVKTSIQKKFFISMVASSKTELEGHKLRHTIIKKLLNSNIDIHIYGRGIESMYRDSRIKGTIQNTSDAYEPYMFTIAIENVKENAFISEKFYDPILCECVPIYWGPDLVDTIFNNNCYKKLSDNILDNLNYINYYDKIIEVKNKILKKEIGMPEFIWKHFNK